MDYLLTPFEVTELLCRVYTKKEGLPAYTRTPDIEELAYIFRCTTLEYAKEVSNEVYNNKELCKRFKVTNRGSRLLHDMRLAAQKESPYLISDGDLRILRAYLGTTKKYIPVKATPDGIAGITEKQLLFETLQPRWYLHYFSENVEGESGIVRLLLQFGCFGEVRIKGTSEKNTYLGYYRSYGNGDYLYMELKTEDIGGKDLHILVACGKNMPKLMLGQYHNVNVEISSGTIVLQPSTESYNDYIPEFLKKGSPEYELIPELIRKFLSIKSRNEITVTNVVTDFDSLAKWFKTPEGQYWLGKESE